MQFLFPAIDFCYYAIEGYWITTGTLQDTIGNFDIMQKLSQFIIVVFGLWFDWESIVLRMHINSKDLIYFISSEDYTVGRGRTQERRVEKIAPNFAGIKKWWGGRKDSKIPFEDWEWEKCFPFLNNLSFLLSGNGRPFKVKLLQGSKEGEYL